MLSSTAWRFAGERVVEFASPDRNQLFAAWDAVQTSPTSPERLPLSVRAESEKGFDRGKLQNGVIEPLKEGHLIE